MLVLQQLTFTIHQWLQVFIYQQYSSSLLPLSSITQAHIHVITHLHLIPVIHQELGFFITNTVPTTCTGCWIQNLTLGEPQAYVIHSLRRSAGWIMVKKPPTLVLGVDLYVLKRKSICLLIKCYLCVLLSLNLIFIFGALAFNIFSVL